MKDIIIKTLNLVDRKGMKDLLSFLENSDFFTAPCSTKYHLNVPGGLAQHSFNVYNLLSEKVNRYKLEIDRDSIIISGICHDLCKVNYYEKIDIDSEIVYTVKDNLPLGHGEKSISILQDYIRLTDIEKLAIRWHMGAWDLSESGKWSFNNAALKTPLVTLLSTADFEASQILER